MLSSTFSFQATADSYLKQLKNDMYEIMEQPLPDQISNVPSGKALKMIYYDLICRCEDKWKTWDEVLLWLVHMIEVTVPMYGLCRHIPGIETLTIQSVNTWKHNYPIPDDEIDNKNLAISEVQANVRSHKSYIEEFSNSEDADKEFDTIIKEMTEINESNNSSLGLDDFNDEPDADE